ncbi:MAG: SDR family oxidoreductase [Myxococcota bacterium]
MAAKFDSVFRPDLFAGRVALVTGGGTGLGRCTAHELASLGAQVVIAARRSEPLEQTAAEIVAAGGKCSTATVNIRDENAIDAMITTVLGRHGRLDCVVNNAGGQFVAPLAEMSPNGWRTVIDLNLNGTYLVSRAAYRAWMKDHGGSIVNMLADIWTGYPGMGHMSAARAGIENMTFTMALEWARSDVRVNCVAPGTMLSNGMLTYTPDVQQRTAADAARQPAARFGTESEVSAAIVFLLSPAAAFITGETIKVDGGAQFQKFRLIEPGNHAGLSAWNGFHLRTDFSGTPYERLVEADDTE